MKKNRHIKKETQKELALKGIFDKVRRFFYNNLKKIFNFKDNFLNPYHKVITGINMV